MNIRTTPQELRDQSDQLISNIREIKKHWKAIAGLVNGTANYWEGEAGRTHTVIFRDTEDDADAVLGRLEDALVRLQSMAGVNRKTKTADEEAAPELPSDVF